MMAPSARRVTQNWAYFDPMAYLDEYYADLGGENLGLLEFLAEIWARLPKGGVMLDFGGGPAIYTLISAAARVDEIHFADYLETNLDEVRRWLADEPLAFDWDDFIRKALELESGGTCSDQDIDRRAREIRECVTRVMSCDASRTPPIERPHRMYDVVSTSFCAESATSDRAQWQAYMANIVSVLKPGGWLVMSALEGATRYSVGPHAFPAVDVSAQDLLDVLEQIGFPRSGIELRSIPADRPSRDYAGLMVAVAAKAGGPARRSAR